MNKGHEPYNLVWMESLTRKTTKEKHWKEIEICTGILNTFLSGFSSIGFFELKEDNESEYIWLLILIRCFNSIRCAIDMLLKGYYSQAMSLLRTATEDWFICGNERDDEFVPTGLLICGYPKSF